MKLFRGLIILFVSFPAFAQPAKENPATKLFNRAVALYNAGKQDSAIVLWTEIVENKLGIHYDTYGSAFFNIPTAYWEINEKDKAKEWFKKILASNLADNVETGDIMEPHANYKHKSAMALAGLYQSDSNYRETLNWLYKADTVYRYWGFEGSATNISTEQEYMLAWKANLYVKLNEKDKAIREIIIQLICSGGLEKFFQPSEDRLLALVNKATFKSDFDRALNKLYIQTIDKDNWAAIFTVNGLKYSIPINDIFPDRSLPHYYTKYFINKGGVIEREKFIADIKGRSFYKRL